MENENNANLNALHTDLKDGLEHEIRLTRELLANMRQEEISLMLHDSGTLNQVLQVRSELVEKLSALRVRRLETTAKMEKIAAPLDTLPPEILSLSDQLTALNERMNRQQSQNQRISEAGDHSFFPALSKEPEMRPKRKASVATYNPKQ